MKVLVVDDDPATTRAIAKFLRQNEFDVEEAHNALDAADHVIHNEFQVALIDWDLRGGSMSGLELGRAVRRQGVGTFLMSGHTLAEMRANWTDPLEGFLQFFPKPIDWDDLLAKLEAVRRSFEGTKP